MMSVAMTRFAAIRLALVAAVLIALYSGSAQAIDIKRVVSPDGIEAWLVEEHAIPMIAMSFSTPRGAYFDPPGKEGLSYLLSATLDEGAGELDSQAFRARLEDHAISLSFDSGRDEFSGSLTMLTEFRDEGFELLRLAMTEPRFDEEPVERMKTQILADIRADETDPGAIASKQLFEAVFGPQGYGRPSSGHSETLEKLGPDDLRGFHADQLALDGMKIGVVGDITAEELAPLLDATFGNLKRQSAFAPILDVESEEGPRVVAVELDVPQTELRFSLPGLERSDPDFVPGYVMNYILGGGGFSSRLYDEVREKRGLSYSVYSALFPFRGTGLLFGGAATRADRARETLDVIRGEIRRMAEEGPSAQELDAAKRYLTGAYPLRFDSNSKIANQLVAIQIEDLGIDYIDKRNALIEAVTIEDIRRVAERVLKPDQLIIVAVGRKESIEDIKSGG